ncbi:hypothetical protein V5799_006242 [Amblyomma americanum]|uniref:Uncharacterized protein n=1 Tax=Amblyomma americanum TaxID=6943 RepID=A0AAQ4DWY4_AMBAM
MRGKNLVRTTCGDLKCFPDLKIQAAEGATTVATDKGCSTAHALLTYPAAVPLSGKLKSLPGRVARTSPSPGDAAQETLNGTPSDETQSLMQGQKLKAGGA